MRLAKSGARGVHWKPNPRSTYKYKGEPGDFWIVWTCGPPHAQIHERKIGPWSLAVMEVQRHRLERPCPLKIPETTPTVGPLLWDLIQHYVTRHSIVKRSESEDKRYGRLWRERFKDRLADSITTAELMELRAKRIQSRVAPATVNRDFQFLRRVYNVAIEGGLFTGVNPVRKSLRLRESPGRVRYLREDDREEERLLAVLSPRDQARVAILLSTGLRRSEFLHLRPMDLDLKLGMISVPRSKNGEPRHVEMTPQVLSIFRGLPRPLKADGYYFTNHAGQPHYRWFKRILPKRIAQAGLENFRAHDLRHTWASRLVMSGVDLVTLQQLGGWKSITMVQRYAHLSPGHRRAAINRLPEIPLADGSVTRPEVRKRIDT